MAGLAPGCVAVLDRRPEAHYLYIVGLYAMEPEIASVRKRVEI
jgi:hypothetical protein